MPNYRLLATDIDDTILGPDGSIPEANRDALRRLHAAGIVVVFASGRATVSTRALAARILELEDDEYLITFNGARVVSARSDRPLVERFLSREVIAPILMYCRSNGLQVQGYGPDSFLVEDESEGTRRYAGAVSMRMDVVPSLYDALPDGTPKLLIIDEHEALLEHQRAIMAQADGAWVSTFSKPTYLEILAPGVSKGSALESLARHLGVPIEQTVAAGDSLNDVEMLQAAGVGVAVANARDDVKTAADVVLERTAAEGSIAEIAERLFGL